MKKLFFITLVAFLSTSLFLGAFAQEKQAKVIDSKSTLIENTRAANPNIATPKPTDDSGVKTNASRGASCTVYINNYSDYCIDVYIDGNWKGSIAAGTSGWTTAVPGRTKFYGLSCGGTRQWGPWYFDCDYSYTWNLYN